MIYTLFYISNGSIKLCILYVVLSLINLRQLPGLAMILCILGALSLICQFGTRMMQNKSANTLFNRVYSKPTIILHPSSRQISEHRQHAHSQPLFYLLRVIAWNEYIYSRKWARSRDIEVNFSLMQIPNIVATRSSALHMTVKIGYGPTPNTTTASRLSNFSNSANIDTGLDTFNTQRGREFADSMAWQ